MTGSTAMNATESAPRPWCRRIRVLAAVVVAALATSAMSARAQVGAGTTSAYRGSWASMSGSGGLDMSLVRSGENITGTAVFNGHPCFEIVRVSGRVSGNTLAATLTSVDTAALGNTRLVQSPRGLDGSFSFVSGCAAAPVGSIVLFLSDAEARTLTPTPAVTPPLTPMPTPMATLGPAVPGDCDGDAVVTVVEIVTILSVNLGSRPLSDCRAADINGDGEVTVDEVVRAMFAALTGIGTSDVPPPVVQRCLGETASECLCRGDVCCVAGSCRRGDPCRRTTDCQLGMICLVGAGGTSICSDAGGIVVPPPR